MSRDSAWVYKKISSPVGDLRLISDGEGLSGIFFDRHKGLSETEDPWMRDDETPVLVETAEQLDAYFKGARRAFDVKLSLHGTDFQKRIWAALRGIGFGETTSYGTIAEQVGSSIKASRAVGGAVGRNPVSIVIPCHRVIGSNESLTGFAGGLDRKRWLLKHEGASVMSRAAEETLAFLNLS